MGDAVEIVTEATGIKSLVKFIAGEDCGCEERKASRYKGAVDANAIPIGVIVSHYGGEVREGKSASVRCCLHSDSRRSAVINTYDNLYFCHTCGKGGNAANLVCILKN